MGDNQHRHINFMDLAKGVCITLVVVAYIGDAFDQLDKHSMLSCFHMSPCFFISGIFFKSYEGLYGFIIRKINKLIAPFIFFYISAFLLEYIVWETAPETFHLPMSWRELLFVFYRHDLIKSNPPTWLLLALFSRNILLYPIHYLRDKHLFLMFTATLLIGCTGFLLDKLHIELLLYINVATTAFPFYVTGFWVRRYNFSPSPSHRFDKTIPSLVLLALVVTYFTATTPGMRTDNYPDNIFQIHIVAFAGISMIMLICKKIKRISIVSYLGRYSIIILSTYGPIIHLARPVVSHYVRNDWAEVNTLFLLTLTICILSAPILPEIIPQLVAQKDLLKVK